MEMVLTRTSFDNLSQKSSGMKYGCEGVENIKETQQCRDSTSTGRDFSTWFGNTCVLSMSHAKHVFTLFV